MAHAETCPICGGTGKFRYPLLDGSSSATPLESTCHGCGGLGWVTVQDRDRPRLSPPMFGEPRAKSGFHKHTTIHRKSLHQGEGSD